MKELSKRLALASARRPLFVFLDAVDQLADHDDARDLMWLPAILPDGVHVVLSTVPGKCRDALRRKLLAENLLELQPMSASEGTQLLTNWLAGAGRRLQPRQFQEVITRFSSNGLPLYLKLAFEEARLWKSYTPFVSLSPDVPGIIHDLLDRLADDANHGLMLVSRTLG